MSEDNQPVEQFRMKVQPDRRVQLPSAEKMAAYVAGSYDAASGKDWTSYMAWSRDMIKAMREWFLFSTQYEVDPSWRGFCEFGYGDIGGPFEQLGIIRKREKPAIQFRPWPYQVTDLPAGWWNDVPLDVRAKVAEIADRAIEAVDSHSEKMVVGFNIPRDGKKG